MNTQYAIRNTSHPPLRVALDTSFAGLNPTGVGKYSRRLVEHIGYLAQSRNVRVRCYGPCQTGDLHGRALGGLYYEWPSYTQVALPLFLTKYHPDVVHSTSHLGPTWGPGRRVVTVHDVIFRRYPEDYDKLWLATTRALLPR